MGFPITNESQIIDLATVKSGCEKLRECAKTVNNARREVDRAADSSSSLTFGLRDPGKYIANYADTLVICSSDISRIANSIEESAQDLYDKQRKQLQEYRTYLWKKEHEAARQAHND